MQRVIVGGSSGAGKSTLARAVSTRLQLPYVELDSLFHGSGWVRRPSFEADVDAFTAQDTWITDSLGYPSVMDVLWDRADTLIWLDYPRLLCELRVVRRSIVRGALRQPLWNGNRESLWRMVTDPEHPVRWCWQHYDEKRELVETRSRDARWSHLTVVRLATTRATARWAESLLPGAGPG